MEINPPFGAGDFCSSVQQKVHQKNDIQSKEKSRGGRLPCLGVAEVSTKKYPLVNNHIAIAGISSFSRGNTLFIQGPFSIAMLFYRSFSCLLNDVV